MIELLDDSEKRKQLGRAAYQTMSEKWNGENVAERFLELSKVLKEGKDTPYPDGPCSKAERLFQWDMYKYCKEKNR